MFAPLIVVICVLVSVIAGIIAGQLRHTPLAPTAPAFLFSGGVFGGALTLCLLVMSSLGVRSYKSQSMKTTAAMAAAGIEPCIVAIAKGPPKAVGPSSFS
jgi:hypothetical protein